MKRIRIVGLCLVAVFAMMAVAAASASAAAPEYLICGKASKVGKEYTGKYTSKTCEASSKVATGGKYELESYTFAKKLGFKAKSGPSALYVYEPGVGRLGDTTCKESKTEGEVTGAKTATDVVTFEKCESSGKVCTSAGAKKGDIITSPLHDTLFATSESKSGVANESKGAGPGGLSAEFDCEGEEVKTTGAVSGEQTGDIGVASKDFSLIYTVTAEGAPTIASSEPLITEIKGTATLPSGEEISAEVKGEAFYVS